MLGPEALFKGKYDYPLEILYPSSSSLEQGHQSNIRGRQSEERSAYYIANHCKIEPVRITEPNGEEDHNGIDIVAGGLWVQVKSSKRALKRFIQRYGGLEEMARQSMVAINAGIGRSSAETIIADFEEGAQRVREFAVFENSSAA